ncbi:MAG: hypothetical protein LBJ90_02090 [Treponema sp.]|jgi:hypothetical protein|nr:hypothetical protein [Treponema sp.]
MRKIRRIFTLLALSAFMYPGAGGLEAQDFGFGFEDSGGEGEEAPSFPLAVKAGGKISAELLGYVQDFKKRDDLNAASLGDIFSGNLNFSAAGANADAYVNLDLSVRSFRDLADYSSESGHLPRILDEAYLRAYFGPLSLEAGLRKLTWGRADSLGPLDVVNPLDYSDLTNITDMKAMKIARPLVRLSWAFGALSRLEGVFVPGFAGHRFSGGGRWQPAQFRKLPGLAMDDMTSYAFGRYASQLTAAGINSRQFRTLLETGYGAASDRLNTPDTRGLEYAQAGLRYTVTVGSSDLGFQYFYGNLFTPSWNFEGLNGFVDRMMIALGQPGGSGPDAAADAIGGLDMPDPKMDYNRYHQLGLDYGRVLGGFNIRAEFAACITDDLGGDKGWVRNPFLAWSFGFDRDIVWGINANFQCNETVRLLNDRVGGNPLLDCEAGTDISATRITLQLSRKFLRDDLECKVTNIWDIEDRGCYIIPALLRTIKDLSIEVSAGLFAGREEGELGQYWRNSFVKLGIAYSF